MIKLKLTKIICLISVFVLLVSCEQAADVSVPVTYDQNGIYLQHPKNWKITEDAEQDDVRYMIVESPGDAIFIVQVYLAEDAVSINEYAEWFSDEAIKETPVVERTVGEFNEIEATINGEKVTGLRQNFSIKVFNLDVPHVSEYYRVEKGNKVGFIICQAAQDDLKKVKTGFDLLINSFKLEF